MNLLDINLLEKLTVVIISKDRIKELEIVIDYWLNTPCKLVVIHDSKEHLDSSHFNKNFLYIRSHEHYLIRLSLAENFITTPYSVICNDDEIFLIDPLLKFINYLDSDKTIEAIGGQVMAYSWGGNKLLAEFVYPYLNSHSNDDKSPSNRIRNTFETKNVMDITLIYRSEKFKKIIACCKNFSEFTVPVMGEMMFALFSSYFCRSKRFEDIYWMRNWFTPFHNSEKWDRRLTWNDWCHDSRFKQEVEKWNFKLELVLSNKTSLSNMQRKEVIKFLLDWRPKGSDKLAKKKSIVCEPIRNVLKLVLPGSLIWTLKKLFPLTRNHVMSDFKTVMKQQNSAYKISLNDVDRFKLFVKRQKLVKK